MVKEEIPLEFFKDGQVDSVLDARSDDFLFSRSALLKLLMETPPSGMSPLDRQARFFSLFFPGRWGASFSRVDFLSRQGPLTEALYPP